jgi:hypothetical protein
LLALWILGTHYHEWFQTFPILYLNAMKGSGKTRALGLISHLSLGLKGSVQNNITESGVFRSGGTLCLDEMENLSIKGRDHITTLLNSVYKKGAEVTRLNKVKKEKSENFEPESHSLFIPLAIANINGLDSVLEDRSLILLLEKSFDPIITSRVEDFDYRLGKLKKKLENFDDRMTPMTGMTLVTDIIKGWNDYLDTLIGASHVSQASHVSLYERIYGNGINGRTLELCLPLLLIAYLVGDSVFQESLELFSKISKMRKNTELDDVHVTILRFVALQDEDYTSTTNLLERFSTFSALGRDYNPTSFSLALRRLSVVKKDKRSSNVRLIQLDVEKAKQKVGLFESSNNAQEIKNLEKTNPLQINSVCVDCGSDFAPIIIKEQTYCKECAYKR